MTVLIGSKEFAELLGVSMRTLDNMEKRGELPNGLRVGHLRRWRVEDVEKWIAQRVQEAPVTEVQ